MWKPIFVWNYFSLTWLGIVLFIGFWVTSFLIWRKMREDYDEEDILALISLMAVGALVGNLSKILFLVFSIPFLVLIWWCKKKKWDFWQWLDVLSLYLMPLGALSALAWGPRQLWMLPILTVGFLSGVFLLKKYRSFTWYLSGKPGLVGIVSAATWSVILANQWSWRIYLFVWIAIATMVCVYLRSQRKIKQDLADVKAYVRQISQRSFRARQKISI